MMRRPRITRLARRAPVPAGQRVAGAVPQPTAQAADDKVPLILFGYDAENRQLLHCNQHCQTVLGHSSQALVAMGQQLGVLLMHPDSRAQLLHSNLPAMLPNGRPLSWDCRMRHADGSWRWLRIRMRASAFGAAGQVREITGSAEDVTRHRAAVDELRQNRHMLRRVVDLVPNVIYVYDLRHERLAYVNQRVESFVGYTADELLALPDGALLPSLFSPEAATQMRAHIAEVAQLPDGALRTMEAPVAHRDGSRRWLRGTHAPFARDASGQVICLIGVAEDVTERQAADRHALAVTAQQAEQHRLFRQVIDALPHPVYLRDGQGHYQLANHAAAALFGLTPEELVREGPPCPELAAHQQDQDKAVLATGQDVTREESHTYPDGKEAWFSSVKKRFGPANGPAQVLGVDSNITELKRTQQALEAAIASAEVDAQAKQDFLANMSHEIRTPLHGILGLTGVLAKTTLSRSQHDYLRLLGESADHLLAVLDDVLTTARLGAGKLHPESIPFSPEELVASCAALLRPRAREKGLRLRVEKPAALPAVLGDAHRLRQVLLNLVSNAIKFTDAGRVRLSVRRVPGPQGAAEPAGTVWLQFAVSDTGVGMTADTMEKVFEPFTQAAASTDREYGGSGLGLSISEGIVRLMGGVLRVSSEVDQGSTFAFTLAFRPVPVVAATEPVALPPPPPEFVAGRVLLVEDNLVNSLLAETVLRNWGWQVTTAASGPAAIKLFEFRPFDIVLMDIQMPGMDGETAARALRSHPDPARAATPVVALTARAQAGEAARLLASGFAGYLTKPYREEQLLETIQAVLARQNHAAEPAVLYTIAPALSMSTLYNLSNVHQLVRNDETIVRRLAWAFIETTPAILTALDEALTKGDWEAVGDAAHHLKSSLDGLSVESLRAVIREMEAYGTAPPTPAHAAQQVAQVRATTEQVMADLRREFPEEKAPQPE